VEAERNRVRDGPSRELAQRRRASRTGRNDRLHGEHAARGADWGWNTTDERIVVYAGGVPLFADGLLVGGVGASGGAAAEDEECVASAVRALRFTVE
jgi:uncharacterized protein GlcG (DUF336 family)